jgi:hypothetical protein
MATVLISKALKYSVDARIQKMRQAEMATYIPVAPTADLTALVEHVLWGEHLPLLQQIPHKWLHDVGPMRLEVKNLSGGGEMLLRLQVPKAKMPPTTDYVPYNKDFVMTKAQLFDSSLDVFPEVHALRAAVDLTEEGAAVHAKWSGVQTAINTLLNTARSVNEAVTLVPALRLYLDDDIKARLDTVVAKAPSNTKAARAARAAELVANVDVEGIAASGVAGTLIMGNAK